MGNSSSEYYEGSANSDSYEGGTGDNTNNNPPPNPSDISENLQLHHHSTQPRQEPLYNGPDQYMTPFSTEEDHTIPSNINMHPTVTQQPSNIPSPIALTSGNDHAPSTHYNSNLGQGALLKALGGVPGFPPNAEISNPSISINPANLEREALTMNPTRDPVEENWQDYCIPPCSPTEVPAKHSDMNINQMMAQQPLNTPPLSPLSNSSNHTPQLYYNSRLGREPIPGVMESEAGCTQSADTPNNPSSFIDPANLGMEALTLNPDRGHVEDNWLHPGGSPTEHPQNGVEVAGNSQADEIEQDLADEIWMTYLSAWSNSISIYQLPGTSSSAFELPGTSSNAFELPGASSRSSRTHELPSTSSSAFELAGTSSGGSRAHELPSTSSNAFELPGASSRAHELPNTSSSAFELPGTSSGGSRAHELPSTSSNAFDLPGASSSAFELPRTSSRSSSAQEFPSTSSIIHELPLKRSRSSNELSLTDRGSRKLSKRTFRFKSCQLERLESEFQKSYYIEGRKKVVLAEDLKVNCKTILRWFARRRKKEVVTRNKILEQNDSQYSSPNNPNLKLKRSYYRFMGSQLERLESEFQRSNCIDWRKCEELAEDLKVDCLQIKWWFARRRKKEKVTRRDKILEQNCSQHSSPNNSDESKSDEIPQKQQHTHVNPNNQGHYNQQLQHHHQQEHQHLQQEHQHLQQEQQDLQQEQQDLQQEQQDLQQEQQDLHQEHQHIQQQHQYIQQQHNHHQYHHEQQQQRHHHQYHHEQQQQRHHHQQQQHYHDHHLQHLQNQHQKHEHEQQQHQQQPQHHHHHDLLHQLLQNQHQQHEHQQHHHQEQQHQQEHKQHEHQQLEHQQHEHQQKQHQQHEHQQQQ